MNNRIISALVLVGMIASTSAFASRARNLVMGQGGAEFVSGRGSFYYDDAYNFFYNPAYINDYKNWVIIEKDAQNQASAGFVTSMMNFNMGVFFNRENAAANPQADHALDLFFGGDAGVKWGVNLMYAGKSAAASNTGYSTANELDARVGLAMNGFDPYISYRMLGKSKISNTEVAKYKGMGAGLRYHYGEWTPYVAYNYNKREVGTEVKNDTYVVGLGRETKIAEGTRLVYALYYSHAKSENKATGAASTGSAFPVQMAIEGDPLSWLTLRAGVNHTLITSTSAA
ncbi:MAG: hypothetical protein H7301_13790, partial [Cryobacterium sp.]|nr:hypothetical protein [Oligoflexia bacterium]